MGSRADNRHWRGLEVPRSNHMDARAHTHTRTPAEFFHAMAWYYFCLVSYIQISFFLLSSLSVHSLPLLLSPCFMSPCFVYLTIPASFFHFSSSLHCFPKTVCFPFSDLCPLISYLFLLIHNSPFPSHLFSPFSFLFLIFFSLSVFL